MGYWGAWGHYQHNDAWLESGSMLHKGFCQPVVLAEGRVQANHQLVSMWKVACNTILQRAVYEQQASYRLQQQEISYANILHMHLHITSFATWVCFALLLAQGWHEELCQVHQASTGLHII